MDSNRFKTFFVSLLASGAFAVFPCSESLPPSYIDLQDAAYSPELEIPFHLKALAEHYFPDCIPVNNIPEPAEKKENSDKGNSPEYRLYEAGWEALRRNPENRFPEEWKRLLALPESERRHRTARTLYLLGNLHAQDNPRQAYEWYQKLRTAVNRGIPDPENLAQKSFRTNYFYVKDPVKRLRYLVLAVRYGRCLEKREREPGSMVRCAFHQELWKELSTMIRNSPERFLNDPLTAEIAVLFHPVLIRKAGGPFICGDRLALRAFQRGDFESCGKLLAGMEKNSPLRLYLEARLARRNGDYRKSAELLGKWLELYRNGRKSADVEAAERSIAFTPSGIQLSEIVRWGGIYWPYNKNATPLRTMHEDVRGQLGASQYRNDLFLEALYSFLIGKAWSDAALIAEEHLSTEELGKFADAHENNPRIPGLMTECLRNLLARRLMRENRFKEAGKYFSADLRDAQAAFADLAAAAENPNLPREQRAAAYFRLGQLMLRHDIALFGYELAPDYYICAGSYDSYPIRQHSKHCELPRFHYRFREAGYFRMAAMLTEDAALRFLSYLAGGYILRNRTPKQAEPFYHRLVRERFIPYSELLDRCRWIPAQPENWKQVITSCDPADQQDVQKRINLLLNAALRRQNGNTGAAENQKTK